MLLTLTGFVSYFLLDSYENKIREEENHLLNLSKVASDVMERRLYTADTLLQVAVEAYPEWSARNQWREADLQLQRLVKIGNGTDILALLDESGTMVAVNRAELRGQNFAYRYYFEKAKSLDNPNERVISPPFQSVLGDYTFTISRKIVGADGKFLGVAMATIDTPFLSKLLGSTLYATDMWAALAHGSGIQILMTPDQPGQRGKNLAVPGSFFSRHMASGNGVNVMQGVVAATGEERIMALRTVRPDTFLSDVGLVLAIGRLRDAVLKPWKIQAATVGTLLSFLILASISGLLRYQRRSRGFFEQLIRKQSQIDSAKDALFIIDTYGVVIDANPAFLALVGCEQSALGKLPIHQICPEWPDREQLEASSKQSPTPGSHAQETRFFHVDGAEVAVELCIWGAEDNTGQYIFASARDITQRKAMQTALRKRESELRTILDSEPECVKVVDSKGTVIMMNPAGLSMLGADERSQVVGRDVLDFIAPEYQGEFSAFGQSVLHGESGILHFDIIGLNGVRRSMESHSVPLRDDSGQITSILAVTRDITETRGAQEELRKLRLAIEQSPEGICITDLGGAIEYVNPAFATTCGYSREELIGQNPRILSSGQTPERVYREMWDTLQSGRAWSGEFINRRKNGEIYIESEIISPVKNSEGKTTHYLGIKQDVTEKKQLEGELDLYRRHLEKMVAERTEELQASNRELEVARDQANEAAQAKASFLSNMSHEIRTPMNGIIGMLHLLHRTKPDDRQLDYLNKIERSASHLLTLINDILDLSKINAGKLVLESVPVNIGQVVSHVTSIVTESAKAKELSLLTAIDAPTSCVCGDSTRITQVLLNYVSNAVKFTDRGHVKISVGKLSETEQNVMLRFSVEDTGPGIRQDDQKRVFEAFEQAGQSKVKTLKGTGLGLAIARHLTGLMGGEVGLESTVGQGSTFWFSVCLQKCSEQANAEESMEDSAIERTIHDSHAGARILLVEDEPINQEIATLLLEAVGLNVTVASNGLEAIQLVRDKTFALVLMDMQMPEVNGLEATAEIRKMPNGQRLPIVAMTANAFIEDRERCLDAGMDDFLAKPVEPDAMYKMVYRWLHVRH